MDFVSAPILQNIPSWFPCPQGDEDFSVDDLLDLGDIKEQIDTEEEEEDDDDERKASPTTMDTSSLETLPLSEPIVPAGDLADLEWVSRFVDDSYSEFPAVAPFAAPPPLTVSKMAAPPPPLPKKIRSKRSRSGARVWSLSGPLLFPESSSTSSSSSGSSSSSCSSCLMQESPPFPEAISFLLPVKKKGRKPKAVANAAEQRRRCTHCGVDKTPQWRAGPMGSKTLCNACGVRYKSGRLLPEYRPAGSPTFISHVHSNSHRKVLELRRKKEVVPPAGCAAVPVMLAAPPQPYGVV